jgi:hypothetical protein
VSWHLLSMYCLPASVANVVLPTIIFYCYIVLGTPPEEKAPNSKQRSPLRHAEEEKKLTGANAVKRGLVTASKERFHSQKIPPDALLPC